MFDLVDSKVFRWSLRITDLVRFIYSEYWTVDIGQKPSNSEPWLLLGFQEDAYSHVY
jgi:hypothetical protein